MLPKRRTRSRRGPRTSRCPRHRGQAEAVGGRYPVVDGPYDAEDYDALTRRRLDWTAARSKLLAQKHEAARITDIDAIKAKNAPTVEVAVDDPEARSALARTSPRVRQSEAWRYRQLSSMQRQAEIEMEGVEKQNHGHGSCGGTLRPAADGTDVCTRLECQYRSDLARMDGRG